MDEIKKQKHSKIGFKDLARGITVEKLHSKEQDVSVDFGVVKLGEANSVEDVSKLAVQKFPVSRARHAFKT